MRWWEWAVSLVLGALFLACIIIPLVVGFRADASWWLGGGGGTITINPSTTVYQPTGASLTTCGAHTTACFVVPDCTRSLIDNSAAGKAMYVVLCSAEPGMEVWVQVSDTTFNLITEPRDAEDILGPEVVGTGDGLTITATSIVGSYIHLVGVASGEWRVLDSKGTIAVDNGSGADTGL